MHSTNKKSKKSSSAVKPVESDREEAIPKDTWPKALHLRPGALISKWTSSVPPVVMPSGLSKTCWLHSTHGQNSTKVHFINARSYQMLLSLCEQRKQETMMGGKRNYINHCSPEFQGMNTLSGALVNGCMI